MLALQLFIGIKLVHLDRSIYVRSGQKRRHVIVTDFVLLVIVPYTELREINSCYRLGVVRRMNVLLGVLRATLFLG